MDQIRWDASPKKEFNRRRLERCYNLEYPRRSSSPHGGSSVIKNSPRRGSSVLEDQKIPQKETSMGYKSRPHREPYWNFWRAVFAGWLIRYPMQILKGIGMGAIGIFLLIVLALPDSIDYNTNTPNSNSGEVRE